MKEQHKIPTSKIERAGAFVKTGIKIGGNYVKHVVKETLTGDSSRETLHAENAADIYESLSELKGSALKVAQMMSMDRNMLPKAYVDKFQMSQYSAPPLSSPLIVNTFRKAFAKGPSELYDEFDLKAANAASIGQVHKAKFQGKKVAVKIQYPGVAESIKSDLKMVKPFAVTLFGLNAADVDRYTEEVETKLIEETDYYLEVRNGLEIAEACKHISGLHFPKYYPERSSDRIITMDWMPGYHLKEFLALNPSQEVRNKIGQLLWDFYDFQIHTMKQVHADPHPGNFLMREDGTIGVIDFGCVKEIPDYFYTNYFALIELENLKDDGYRFQLFKNLEFIYDGDTEADKKMYDDLFTQMIEMLGRPFQTERFNFGDDEYFAEIYAFAEKLSKMKELKDSKYARGAKDSLYINRTYYGLYNILNDLKAEINTTSGRKKGIKA